LERRWAGRLAEEPRLATLVNSDGARREPIHRWLPYRQGFSPGLVRIFLKENATIRRGDPFCRVLDPFSGSGTCVVECARQGVHAIGVEALSSLVFLAAAKFERVWPPLPELPDASRWERIAERLELPIHRAALMLAESRRHSAEGRPNRGAMPIAETLAEVVAMIRDDVCHPLALANPSIVGDARHLDSVDDESVAGIVSSPPYLSRYDYAQINNPLETIYRFWFGRNDTSAPRNQVRSTPRGRSRSENIETTHEAVAESADALEAAGQMKLAGVVRDYFHDLSQVLAECRRVMRPGGVAWFVVGGARIKDVYLPADLIVAELAESSGFEIQSIRAARDLTPSRRKFGRVGHVAPRESVVVLTRS
jgi:SAM-dependent methyltransferase